MAKAVELEGSARLRRTLRAAGADLKDFSALNKTVGAVVVAKAKTLAPVGPDLGGHIIDTIRAGGTQRAALVRVGTKRMPYAGAIHWGWPGHNIEPNPWVSEAATSTEPTWLEIYFDGLVGIINRIEGA